MLPRPVSPTRFLVTVLTAGALAFLAGCASTPQLIGSQPLPKASGALQPVPTPASPAPWQVADANYQSALAGKSPEARAAYDAAVTEVIGRHVAQGFES